MAMDLTFFALVIFWQANGAFLLALVAKVKDGGDERSQLKHGEQHQGDLFGISFFLSRVQRERTKTGAGLGPLRRSAR
jgi:hypothetical protein